MTKTYKYETLAGALANAMVGHPKLRKKLQEDMYDAVMNGLFKKTERVEDFVCNLLAKEFQLTLAQGQDGYWIYGWDEAEPVQCRFIEEPEPEPYVVVAHDALRAGFTVLGPYAGEAEAEKAAEHAPFASAEAMEVVPLHPSRYDIEYDADDKSWFWKMYRKSDQAPRIRRGYPTEHQCVRAALADEESFKDYVD